MNDDENTRRNVRINSEEPTPFYFYTSVYNEPEDAVQRILLIIESSFQKLANENASIKIEGLKTLNQMIKSYQKYIIPHISDEVIDEICLLTNFRETECLSLRFLSTLIQISPNFYEHFVISNFYDILIQRIQPDENISFYMQLLLFINSTIQKMPESIQMMIDIGLLDNIRRMDQTQFIDQLQIIYSSSFNQIADFSILDSILFYLTFPKSTLILGTLNCIENCISDVQRLENVWENICFDDRLVSLLTNENLDIVSSTISVFTIIFSISDNAIKHLFENMEIINTIISYSFNENMILNMSIFEFLNSLINSANDASNIDNIFELINCMDIKKEMLEYLNFPNQQRLTYLIFNLYLKISLQQIELIYDPDILKAMIQILQTNKEDLQFCAQTLHLIMDKFSSSETLIQSISDIITETNLDEDILINDTD